MQQLIDKFYADYEKSRLTLWHILILTIHVLVGIFFWQAYQKDFVPKPTLKTWTMFYYFMTSFLLLIGYYRQLRNYKVYFLWLLIGAGQFIAYQYLKDNPDFLMKRGSSLTAMQALLFMLITLQLCRQLFWRLTNSELIITYRRFTWYDTDDNRKMTWLDVLFSSILYGVTILACTLG